MKRLRWWTVALVLALIVFYNIERLSVGQAGLLDIHAFLYILALVAVVSTIALPISRHLHGWSAGLVWLAVYALGTLLLPDGRWSMAGPMYLYLIITEAAMLFILVWVAYQVSSALLEFAEAVEQVTVPDAERWVIQLQDATEAIQTEVNRSRRYERPLSVVCVRPDFDTVDFVLHHLFQEVQKSIAHHYAIVNLGRMLKISMRRTDLVTLEDRRQGCFIALCPETDRAGALALEERIRQFAHQELGFSVVCGAAMFPEDALTFKEVVQQALTEAKAPDDKLRLRAPDSLDGVE